MESVMFLERTEARSSPESSLASPVPLAMFEADLTAAADVDDALDALDRLAEDLGYHRVSYSRRTSRNAVPRQSWYRHFPSDWEDEWERYARSNPFLRTSFANNLPFSWDEVETSPDHPLEIHTIRYLRRCGFAHGITAPVHHADGAVSIVSLVCSPTDDQHQVRTARTRNIVLLAAHLLVSRVEHLLAARSERVRKAEDTFNTREQECLYWASLGKTTGEMATIMGISDNTVKVYFRRIFTRLEVRTRPQAISEAKRRGLLQ
jgi:DNA-binding CsgD family transcriptional regulator